MAASAAVEIAVAWLQVGGLLAGGLLALVCQPQFGGARQAPPFSKILQEFCSDEGAGTFATRVTSSSEKGQPERKLRQGQSPVRLPSPAQRAGSQASSRSLVGQPGNLETRAFLTSGDGQRQLRSSHQGQSPVRLPSPAQRAESQTSTRSLVGQPGNLETSRVSYVWQWTATTAVKSPGAKPRPFT